LIVIRKDNEVCHETFFLVLIVISLTFAGCYTRVAVKEDLPEYTYYDDSEQYGNYSQQYDSDSAAYDTVYYDDSSSEEYRGLEDRVVTNYYYDTPVYDFSPWYRVSVLSPYYDPYYSWIISGTHIHGARLEFILTDFILVTIGDHIITILVHWDNYYNYGYYGYAYNYNGGYSNYGTHPGHTRNNDGEDVQEITEEPLLTRLEIQHAKILLQEEKY
jgi:hypothetical protein